ncbi:hypothetical protein [Sphingobacterium sp.]|uniref:hypothetical protein n=1 Tax=Sphingobacterium sp. TaxID=341027 RepID=UPI002FDE1A5C
MRNTIIVTVLWMLSGCISHENSLHITVIEGTPKRIVKENEMQQKQYYNTYSDNAERLIPTIRILSKEHNSLKLSIQGNISSAGLSINKVRKLRLEEGTLEENRITLKYIVEIEKIPGKESANIRGYNYGQTVNYSLSKGVKYVKVQLYENYTGSHLAERQTLVFEETFNITEST